MARQGARSPCISLYPPVSPYISRYLPPSPCISLYLNHAVLAKARNFTAAHTLVECGGYGYVAINSSGPIDLGSDEATGLLSLTLTLP